MGGLRARGLALAAAGLAVAGFLALPVPRVDDPVSTVLLDREGRLLGARIAADEQWRFPARDTVPERFALAVTTFEDRRFAWHPGVDPLALGRALWDAAATGEVRSGASTLTMQVVRISRDDPPRTVPEKLREVVLAARLEVAASKEEILATWASHAPFGGNTVGLDAAAFRYFGRSADDLSWGEAATLAVLPNAPALVRPGRHAGALRAKRDRLLDAMVARGVLDAAEAALAKAEPLPGPPRPVPSLAPHLLDHAGGAFRVATTLDPVLQAQALEVAQRHHERLAANQVHNLAALVVDNASGEVLAYLGNAPDLADREHGNHVDVVVAPRSTGSLLKPFVYEAMLEDGQLLPDSLVLDLPVRLGGFAPENFDRRYEGAVPAAHALARSRNVPAVLMLRDYGVNRFKARLEGLGMTTLRRPADDYGLALALGGAEGTLLELVSMYRRLARAVSDPGDPEVPVHWRGAPAAVPPALPLDPASAWLTIEALVEVNRPGADTAWRTFSSSRRVAWKTGTSMGFRDGWAIAVTPGHTVGVWVGNASGEGRPGLTGYEAAAPLLFELLDLVPPSGWFARPEGLVDVEVCADSGMRAGPDCPHRRVRAVQPAGLEAPACAWCERVFCDAGCAHRLTAECAPLEALRPEPWFVLPPAVEERWVRRHPTYRSLPPMAPGCEDPAASAAISLVTPREGAVVYVPVELDGARGRVLFEAAHRDRRAKLWWHLDGEYLGETSAIHEMGLAPAAGEHELVLVDAEGGRLSRRFTVLARTDG